MNTLIVRIKILSFLIPGLVAISCSSTPEVALTVNNPLKEQRRDAILLFSRGEISRWTDIPADQLPVLTDLQGNFIPCQADDLNGDGTWDELFAILTLEAEESKSILIKFLPHQDYPGFTRRTGIHLGDARNNYQALDRANRLEGVSYDNYAGITESSFQMEGVAWENDKVGFRNYMDQRNGMDIFGKTTSAMVLDEVGKKDGPGYHEPAAWGMDVLKVGTSLGAGGIAYMYKDSLYRVGDNGSGSFELLFQGPLRSRFVLAFENWKLADHPVQVNHQIEIAAGRHYYQAQVSYSGTEEELDLVPGIVNMLSDTLYVLELNDHYTALLTHDRQSEDGSVLAMALMLPSAYLVRTGKTRDQGEGIIQTFFGSLDASPDHTLTYRFYALWEKEDPRWASPGEVIKYLETEAERWTQSVIYYNRQ